jgi:two-component system response regulator
VTTVARPIDVLLVEDDPNDADLAMRVLKNSIPTGYAINHVSDGMEAVDYIATHANGSPGLPRLVLLDPKLPKLDGFEVLKRIRSSQEWSRVPVVILSSSSIEADVVRSYRLGANAYVVKRMLYDEYKETVEHIAKFWLEIVL